MMIQLLITPLIALSSCASPRLTHMLDEAPPPPPARPTQIIWIPENYDWQFDAMHGDTLNLIMTPDDGWVDRCNDAGGEPIWNPFTRIAECDDVDF